MNTQGSHATRTTMPSPTSRQDWTRASFSEPATSPADSTRRRANPWSHAVRQRVGLHAITHLGEAVTAWRGKKRDGKARKSKSRFPKFRKKGITCQPLPVRRTLSRPDAAVAGLRDDGLENVAAMANRRRWRFRALPRACRATQRRRSRRSRVGRTGPDSAAQRRFPGLLLPCRRKLPLIAGAAADQESPDPGSRLEDAGRPMSSPQPKSRTRRCARRPRRWQLPPVAGLSCRRRRFLALRRCNRPMPSGLLYSSGRKPASTTSSCRSEERWDADPANWSSSSLCPSHRC